MEICNCWWLHTCSIELRRFSSAFFCQLRKNRWNWMYGDMALLIIKGICQLLCKLLVTSLWNHSWLSLRNHRHLWISFSLHYPWKEKKLKNEKTTKVNINSRYSFCGTICRWSLYSHIKRLWRRINCSILQKLI